MFILNWSVTKGVTRSSVGNDLWIPQTKLTIRRQALPYSGATLCNSLPLEIRQSTSLNTFKIRAYL